MKLGKNRLDEEHRAREGSARAPAGGFVAVRESLAPALESAASGRVDAEAKDRPVRTDFEKVARGEFVFPCRLAVDPDLAPFGHPQYIVAVDVFESRVPFAEDAIVTTEPLTLYRLLLDGTDDAGNRLLAIKKPGLVEIRF